VIPYGKLIEYFIGNNLCVVPFTPNELFFWMPVPAKSKLYRKQASLEKGGGPTNVGGGIYI